MKLNKNNAIIFVPDNTVVSDALSRTTYLTFAAHQDDIELMAYDAIASCFQSEKEWFTGVVVTDGAGSARSGIYKDYNNEDMKKVRVLEQKKAAYIGEYSAQILLDYSSKEVKDKNNVQVLEDIKNIILATKPEVVYTHNLADKHDTHCAVAIRVIKAIRDLPIDDRPKKLYGCEVWRDLDWVCDSEKVILDTSAHPNLAKSLIGVFDSQIIGGKRYDLAIEGRRIANATYSASHAVDKTNSLSYAMDLTPLILDTNIDIKEYILGYIERFKDDVVTKIDLLLGE